MYKIKEDKNIEVGGKHARVFTGYLDDQREVRIFKAIHSAAKRTDISPSFLSAIVFHEGLNLWMDAHRWNLYVEINAFNDLGADRFYKEKNDLIQGGFLRSNFGSKDFYTVSGNLEGETGEQHIDVNFKNVEAGIEAVAAMLAYRRSLVIKHLNSMGIDAQTELSEETLNYWTAVYSRQEVEDLRILMEREKENLLSVEII